METASAGVLPEKVNELLVRARREIDEGLLPSCQLALAKDGEVVAFETFGLASNDTRYAIFSATKAFVISAVWMLLGERALDVDQPVAEIIPEFGANGKGNITLDHLLLHTAGFPTAFFNPMDWDDRDRRLQTLASWTLDWEPGSKFHYHGLAAHWVLAELIERVTGVDFRRFVHERVVAPLALRDFRLGCPVDEQGEVAEPVVVGEPMTPDELEAAYGVRELPPGDIGVHALLFLSDPVVRSIGIPGGGAISTAADVALFYQALLHNSSGLWDPDVLADGTSCVRNMFPDPFSGVPVSRTRGLVVAGEDGLGYQRMFGRTNSARAFGHDGAGGQIAWADPATGLSFCYLTNGLDQHRLREKRRFVGIASRAANCAPAED